VTILQLAIVTGAKKGRSSQGGPLHPLMAVAARPHERLDVVSCGSLVPV
jgi:hypothetical protein